MSALATACRTRRVVDGRRRDRLDHECDPLHALEEEADLAQAQVEDAPEGRREDRPHAGEHFVDEARGERDRHGAVVDSVAPRQAVQPGQPDERSAQYVQ